MADRRILSICKSDKRTLPIRIADRRSKQTDLTHRYNRRTLPIRMADTLPYDRQTDLSYPYSRHTDFIHPYTLKKKLVNLTYTQSICLQKHMLLKTKWPSISQFDYLILSVWGWSGGAMVLGKLPVPGRPTNLDNSGARAYCKRCSRCGRGLFGHFFSRLSLLFSFSLSLGDGSI